MLSIIICSKNKELLSQVSLSIARTISVTYEIIAIDNSKSQYGICEAYNTGAAQSKFPYLCFMHEDILFHTEGWGTLVCHALEDLSIGIIGVAGGTAKTRTPSAWYTHDYQQSRINVLQRRWDGQNILDYFNPNNEIICEVVTIDGVWFCCRKNIWETNKFDQKTFKAFHFYDLDFSMQVLQTHRICVVYNVLIEHISPGSINESWLREAFKFSAKWEEKLPVSVDQIPAWKWNRIEYGCQKNLLRTMIEVNFKEKIFLVYLFKYFFSDPKRKSIKNRIRQLIRYIFPGSFKN